MAEKGYLPHTKGRVPLNDYSVVYNGYNIVDT